MENSMKCLKKLKIELPYDLGFPSGSDSKESACNAEDPGLIPESERSPREENSPIHSSILALEIPWTEEPGKAIAYRVSKSWTQLSN